MSTMNTGNVVDAKETFEKLRLEFTLQFMNTADKTQTLESIVEKGAEMAKVYMNYEPKK